MAILLGSGAPKVNFYCFFLHYFNIRSTDAIYLQANGGKNDMQMSDRDEHGPAPCATTLPEDVIGGLSEVAIYFL